MVAGFDAMGARGFCVGSCRSRSHSCFKLRVCGAGQFRLSEGVIY